MKYVTDGEHRIKELEARIALLEAALRQLIACRDEVESYPGPSLDLLGDIGHGDRCNAAWKSARACFETETACEHEWVPTGVTGDNGVLYDCKKCGGKKGWNPGGAVEHWESVPNQGGKQ